ncbi:alpha-glucuronidase [Cellulosilyticum sp. I15G10I2]|uniref:alpha-glucuronidase n=1 Tax=Cellulosilyticum sp. I15G10I2 TaxID=1892843 RepID=UPI00085C62C5|nr:alpha-glucuronidase [Cellulosilyticum sp. I15G10I2]
MNFEKMWLNYRKNEKSIDLNKGLSLSKVFIQKNETAVDEYRVVSTAGKELVKAIEEILCQNVEIMETTYSPVDNRLDFEEEEKGIYLFILNRLSTPDAYEIREKNGCIFIGGTNGGGVLQGAFHLIRQLQRGKSIKGIAVNEKPDNPLRMLNHWDNMDGSIERGYAGNSFFFANNQVLINERTRMYARLMASCGINGTVINNVNVNDAATKLISREFYKPLQELCEIFADYGIKLYLSLNYAAPMELGNLTTSNPLDKEVIAWWKDKMKEIYTYLPKLGGFIVKADSEGRPGPFTYGCNHAQGANMLGKAIEPHGGIIIWRCFVYNCQQDWRDRVTDRARAGCDHFAPLDGEFRDNVILQIKNGPMDFQVREPVSPLFGKLKNTNQILEVQIAQEYTGQQRHVCYLIPLFKEVLGFKTYCKDSKDLVADIISGRTYDQHKCGIATVTNTGDDVNWTGHDLAAANLYGFGRLSYTTSLSAEEIAKEWIQMTFGDDERVVAVILDILMSSWETYEKYTSPLGIGWMVQPNHHYGPSVDGYEYSRWGTYHRADHLGIGVDRTLQGTGYVGQYNEPNASLYNNPETCPEELLLFFHYKKYTDLLSTGKTLIQHIYDTHFEGVEDVEKMLAQFVSLEGLIEPIAYKRILCRLQEQLEHSKEWRDQINTYFYRKSGISDEKGRSIY